MLNFFFKIKGLLFKFSVGVFLIILCTGSANFFSNINILEFVFLFILTKLFFFSMVALMDIFFFFHLIFFAITLSFDEFIVATVLFVIVSISILSQYTI